MPFIYKRKIANIDRSKKRDDDFIHKNIIKGLEFISNSSGSGYVPIMPTRFTDPPFDKADPKKFLVLYATKILGLTFYEVEHWLDNIIENYPIPRDKTPRAYIDERRKYFRQAHKSGSGFVKLMGGFNSTHVIYRSS